jgi:hypothetical protein
VKVGTYVVVAEKDGFAAAVATDVIVNIGTRARVDLSLAVGTATESVEVTAASVTLETDTSSRGQVIGGDETFPRWRSGRAFSPSRFVIPLPAPCIRRARPSR